MKKSRYNLNRREVEVKDMKKLSVRLDEETFNNFKIYCSKKKVSQQETLENYIKGLVKKEA